MDACYFFLRKLVSSYFDMLVGTDGWQEQCTAQVLGQQCRLLQSCKLVVASAEWQIGEEAPGGFCRERRMILMIVAFFLVLALWSGGDNVPPGPCGQPVKERAHLSFGGLWVLEELVLEDLMLHAVGVLDRPCQVCFCEDYERGT